MSAAASAEGRLQHALAHHRAGRLDAAAALYQAVLADDPLEADALQLMGVVLHAKGDLLGAERLVRQALRLRDTPRINANLALVLGAQGRHEEAVEACVRALAAQPNYPEALNTMGAALEQLGRWQEAEAAFRRAIAARPAFAEAWSNLGLVLRLLRRPYEAEAATRHAIELNPASARAHGQMGQLLREAGRPADAEAAYRQQVALHPADGQAQSELAAAIASQGRVAEAAALLPAAITLAPGHPDAHCNLATALHQLGRLAEAEASAAQALALRPAHPEALATMGLVLRDTGRLAEAEAVLRRAVALRPEDSTGYNNLAIVLHDSGRLHEATAVLDLALGLRPDDPELLHHRALLLLLTGRFTEGWNAYEVRFATKQGRLDRRGFTAPLWDGTPPDGRTILLHAEQGFGDTIQFARLVPAVAAAGGRVLLEVQPALARLLSGLPGVAAVLRRGEPLPPFDAHCPLLSLSHALGLAGSIPPPVPLAPPPEALAAWQARLPPGERRRVGIVWAGNPRHVNDRRRTIPFAALAPLWDVPGVAWASLQAGAAAEALAGLPEGTAADLAPLLTDFAETAAALMRMDLVVAADTAVAHLAATLGRPTWLLLPAAPDWRWRTSGEASPWYPGLRLVRQGAGEAWADVVAKVAGMLADGDGQVMPASGNKSG